MSTAPGNFAPGSGITPEAEARWALHNGISPDSLTPAARVVYSRMQLADPDLYPPVKHATPLSPPVHDSLAIAAFALSLAWIGGIGSILAIILGTASRSTARREGRQESPLGAAGVIIGYIGAALALIALVVLLLAISHASSNACTPSNPAWPNC